MRIWLRATTRAAAAALPLMASAPALAIEGDTVVLQGLDKVTARVWTFDVPIGQAVRFGTLEIVPRFCDYRPPEEPPESAAFLDIYEARPGEEKADLFHGWMFGSSPALNALEHPVYDVWVVGCKTERQVMPPVVEEGEKPAQ
ncbi:MAG: DUF2155 domain-containing protein [Alphaproteobacteria bacterium]|nr:DUF2155 domain-containing protein [Alphaproteobacteria bacterium]